MLQALIAVSRTLIYVGVVAFIGAGAIIGGGLTRNDFGGAPGPGGYILGAISGLLLASLVFGIAAAIFDMQRSLRVLAEAARRTSER